MWSRRVGAGLLMACSAGAALGQYPGRVENKPKQSNRLRAVAVLEWTGEPGKPSASRLVPITVFDGDQLQDAGLYLARPAPLAVDTGTEYELERAGVPQGWFDVETAGQMAGDWFGFGVWKPVVVAPRKKLPPARVMPQVVKEQNEDDGLPHLVIHPGAKDTGAGGTAQNGSQSGSQDGGKGRTNAQSGAAPARQDAGSNGTQEPAQQQADDVDPERPTLRRRPKSQPGQTAAPTASSQMETAIAGPDPDRPHLTRGVPANLPTVPEKLQTTPVDLRQMVAVSDASEKEPQPFVYQWADPGDQDKYKQEMEALARTALLKAAGTPAEKPARKTTAARKRSMLHPPPELELQDEQFAAYELTYGGGATLVLTASAVTGASEKTERYVTVIAQPDIYGALQVLFTGTSDGAHLRDAPRMRLVDAVDAKGNHRGDLLFELRGADSRSFALYRVADGRAEQIFSTDALPLRSGG
jgi:hypothetical protein